MSNFPLTWFLKIPKEMFNLKHDQTLYFYSGTTYNKKFLFIHIRYFVYQNREDFDLKPYLDKVKKYVENNF